MGYQDFDRLHEIYTYIFNAHGLTFEVDSGRKETVVFIDEYGNWTRPEQFRDHHYYTSQGFQQFIPDLMFIDRKKNLVIVIEYQEEPTPNRGYLKAKRGKKGHDEYSTHDRNKDLFYELAGFKQIKIWESDQNWTDILDKKLNQIIKKSNNI